MIRAEAIYTLHVVYEGHNILRGGHTRGIIADGNLTISGSGSLTIAGTGTNASGETSNIIETPLEDGGAANELTVFQMVMVPETGRLWLRVIGGTAWTQIDLSSFLHG